MLDSMAIGEAARWCFLCITVFLAVHDVLTFRIPNWGNLLVALSFFPFAFAASLAGIEVQWLSHLVAAALVFAVGFGMFSFGWLGGGDVKLLTACALWMGFAGLLPYVVWVGLAGGVLVFVLLMLRKSLVPLLVMVTPRMYHSCPRVLAQGEKLPYGVAIAAGGMIIALHGGIGLFPV